MEGGQRSKDACDGWPSSHQVGASIALSCQAATSKGAGHPTFVSSRPTAAIPAFYLLVECKRLFSSPLAAAALGR
jgi:hypothetical protein